LFKNKYLSFSVAMPLLVLAGACAEKPVESPLPPLVVTQAVADAMAPGDHGSTFAGNPLVCAAAEATFDVINDGAFLANVAARGEQLRAGLKRELAGESAIWIAGYSNDVLAYIPSKRVLREGGYEAKTSIIYWSNPLHPNWFADTLEERIIGKVHELMK